MQNKFYLYLLLVILSSACAPSRFVKPLNDGQQAINLSLGGPLINYNDLPIPMPFLTASYGYGIDSSLTGFGSVNITSMLYGNAQVELGLSKQFLRQKGAMPALSISPVANVIYRNKDAFKIYPQLDVSAFWQYNQKRNYFYLGLSNWFEFSSKRAYDQEQENQWLLSPMIGHSFEKRRWNYTIETKFIAPGIENNTSPVEYKTPLGKKGALGIYFSLTRKF